MGMALDRRGAAAVQLAVATALVVALTAGRAEAQEGLFVYVPNDNSDSVSVFRTNADGTLSAVTTIANINGAGNSQPVHAAVRGDQAFAYVTLNSDDLVAVIDTSTNTVVQTIATGDGPRGVAISPDGTRVYVANNLIANSMSVFSADSVTGQLTPLTTISTGAGSQPRQVAFSPDGSRLYVIGQTDNSLRVVDTSTNSVLATIPVGNTPITLAVNPAGTRVYVTNNIGTVSVVNTSTNTVVATTADEGDNPRGIVVSADGAHYYVSYENQHVLVQFSAATDTKVGASIAANFNPFWSALSPDGQTLYVPLRGASDDVGAYSLTAGTGLPVFLGTIDAENAPSAVGICGNGNSMLGGGATFVANSTGAFGCFGSNTPTFTGGTLHIGGANLTFGTSMVMQSAGGTVNTNGQDAALTGTLTGAGALTKLGQGTLTLTGDNTYTGGTIINGGTLRLEHSNALGTGALTVLGSTIDYADGLTVANAIDLQNDVTLNVTAGAATHSGNIGGAFGVIKDGGGTLTLTGMNSYRGGTTIAAGTLIGSSASLPGAIANFGALVFDQGFAGTNDGIISGTGALTKRGGGRLTLGGANTYTGATTIAGGTLEVGHAQALGSTGSLTIDAGGTLDIGAFSVGFNRVAGAGDVSMGGGRFTLGVGGESSTFAGRVTGSGTFGKTGGGTLTVIGASTHGGATDVQGGTLLAGAAGVFSPNSTLSVASGALVDLAGFPQSVGALAGNGAVDLGSATIVTGGNGGDTTFGGSITGNGSVVKVGTGTWTLTGRNTYTGGTVIGGGTLRIGATGALGGTSGVTIGEGGTLDLNGFDHRFSALGGTGAVTLGTATLTFDAGDATTSLAASIGGAGRLVKDGAGALFLSGANTYTGGTTVAAGALVGGTTSLHGDIVNHGTVAFDQDGDGTYAGNISGSGALVMQGTGTVTLGGTHSYSGGTLVASGGLIGTTDSLQGGIGVDGALTFDQAFDGVFAGQLSGAGTLTKIGAGTVTVNGAHAFSGLTTVAGGRLALDGALAGSVTVSNGGILSGNGAIGVAVTEGSGTLARPAWASASADADASVAALGQSVVAGNLTVGPQGTLQGGVSATGDSTLVVVGGAARLGGGTLEFVTHGANHARVMQTAVLTAAGGIQGQPDVRLSTPGLEGWATSAGNTLFLTVLNTSVPLTSAAGGANGAAAGGALDRLRAAATGDLRDVTRELAALDDRTLSGALDQVAGAVHATALHLNALDAEAAADLVRGEVASRRQPATLAVETGGAAADLTSPDMWGTGRRWWGRFLGQRATIDAGGDADGGAPGARGHVGGFALGMDWTRGGAWMLGAGVGYALGELTLDGDALAGDTADYSAPRAFGYAGYGRGRWTANLGASVARPSYASRRSIAFTARLDPRFGATPIFGGVDREAAADVSGLDTSVWMETHTAIARGAWVWRPGFGLRAARYARGAWSETGAGALSLAALDQAVTSTQADATVRLTRAHGRVRPYASATYRRELGDGRPATTLQLASDAAGVFTIRGVPFAADRLLGTFGVTTGAASFGYRVDTSGGQTRHAVDLGIRFD